jgi:fatty acid desaturase
MRARTHGSSPRARSTPDLEASNATGGAILAQLSATTGAGIWLSAQASWVVWLLGQIVLAVGLLQWFILLHEAGHGSLFRSRLLNAAAGHIAGVFALIPFESWRRVHGLHHVWTGWQDLDPTTAVLVARKRSPAQRVAVDLAWRWWLPLFSIAYRLGNYWHLSRLWRLFPSKGQRRAMLASAAATVVLYGVVLFALGAGEASRLFAVAILLALALQDPLILSQHTHIPQRVSGGGKVAPLTSEAQASYTRSLYFPPWVGRWVLMGFQAHELHHRFPAVPGYALHRIALPCAREVHWWRWLRAAKRMRGSVFVFETSTVTGLRDEPACFTGPARSMK